MPLTRAIAPRRRATLALLATIAVQGACEKLPGPVPCRSDRDCQAPEVCSDERCVPGQAAVPQSEPCAPAVPDGVCPTDEYCDNGTCRPMPCTLLHPTGGCEAEGEYCSACGLCLDDGICCADADCPLFGSPKCCSTGQCCAAHLCFSPADCNTDLTYCALCGACTALGTCCDERDCQAGEFCSSLKSCIPVGRCETEQDCPFPSSSYTCEAGGCVPLYPCTTNELTTIDCPPDMTVCCPAGEMCCFGHRCRVDGGCAPLGTCIGDSDCLEPYQQCESGWCVPAASWCNGDCSGGCQGTCGSGEICSASGACIPVERCASPADCFSLKTCTGAYTCDLICPSCDCTTVAIAPVPPPPSLLAVLDRSSSMSGACCSPLVEKWRTAVDALAQLVWESPPGVRLGLATYPAQCPSQTCPAGQLGCSAFACGSNNCEPGRIDVPIGDVSATGPEIMQTLCGDSCQGGVCPATCPGGTCPGGNTPTGPTLRAIHADPVAAGLADPDRTNSLVLITDGEASCDPTCSSTPAQSVPLVNAALDSLRNLTPPVRTFVVGLGFSTPSATLNCHAVHGGTSLCGDTVTAANCAAYSQSACYYQANSASELAAELATMAASPTCTFSIDPFLNQWNWLYVYLDYGANPRPAACRQSRCLLGEGPDTWQRDPTAWIIHFAGDNPGEPCRDIRDGLAVPLVAEIVFCDPL